MCYDRFMIELGRRHSGTDLVRLLPAVCVAVLACKGDHASPVRVSEVVFVCEHGAAKSVVASEYFNKLAAERGLAVRAIARGADPQADLSVSAVTGLKADGLSPALGAPRPLTAAEVRSSARLIAFDCEQPTMKALRSMDTCWDDVPTVSDDYARARDAIRAHVATMIDQMVANPKS
jgi:protein-tyrosine-phosphatase